MDRIIVKLQNIFSRELWEKKPLLVQRHLSNYNDGWFSTEELDKILENVSIIATRRMYKL